MGQHWAGDTADFLGCPPTEAEWSSGQAGFLKGKCVGLGQMLGSQKLTMWLFTLCTHLPDFLYLLLISEQIFYSMGFPGDSDSKESTCNVGDLGLIPGSGRFPWRGKWQPTSVFLTGKSHGLFYNYFYSITCTLYYNFPWTLDFSSLSFLIFTMAC